MKIDHVTLMVSSLERSLPYYERHGAGMNHLGFGAGSPEQVREIREAMREAGFDVPEIQNSGVQRRFS